MTASQGDKWMNADDVTQRLSRIQTQWTMLLGQGAAGTGQQLLLRYYGAAYRYLLRCYATQARRRN